MKKINHFLITRFNINLNFSDQQAKVDDDYLKYRFDLFEKYTLKSVINQSCKKFIWLVLFSSSTAPEFKKKISEWDNKYSFFKPLYIDDDKATNFVSDIKRFISDFAPDSNIYITSRCDNDDILHKDFIKNVQSHLKNETFVLTFTNGLQYDINSKIVSKYFFPNNHFTSFFSTSLDNIIYDFQHMEIYEKNKVQECDLKDYMWIEVVHGKNVYNCMGTLKISNYFFKKSFDDLYGIDINYSNNYVYIFFKYFSFIIKKFYIKRKKILKKIKDIFLLKKGRKRNKKG